jgi:N6-L-threonylcarbamoyladenine synthase
VLILGIESSCDETAAAVVESGRVVRSSIIASQNELHAGYGGVVPELASRAHAERILPVVRAALHEAGIGLNDIEAVAVGHRPGLIGSLLVGVAAAKALAWALDRPLVGIDHVHAHLYAGLLCDSGEDAELSPVHGELFPALGLVVSGGHTSMYRVESFTPPSLTRLGGTIDDAMGEAYDKAATILGLPYPGGPNLDRLAQAPGADDSAFDFPVSLRRRDSLSFSFSGLKTSLLYAARGKPLRGGGGAFERDHTALSDATKADLAASFQRAAVAAVLYKLERAIVAGSADGPGYRSLMVGGGVTANSRLRRELGDFARRLGLRLFLPPLRYCVDNAAMIAGLAFHELAAGRAATLDLQAVPTTSA